MAEKIIVIGAGGHGKVVAEAILLSNAYMLVGFADDGLPTGTEVIKGYNVVCTSAQTDVIKKMATHFIVAIGNNAKRTEIYLQLLNLLTPGTVIHPSAVISPAAQLGQGSVVLAGAVINYAAKTGVNTIVNSRVLIDHDTVIGNHCHISQGSTIGSHCVINDGATTIIGQVIPSFSK